MKTQNVVVDIGNLKASDIFFVQGEKGREITFKVINSLLEDFVNLAGYTATIHILKSDGNFTIENMTIDAVKSECYYTLTENDCACGGRGFYDLSFSKNNELIYTAHGDFIGDFRSVNDDTVNSVSVAYGVTFPEGFQMKLAEGDNIKIVNNVISAIVREYHKGTGIDITNDIISISENVLEAIAGKQDQLTAGEGIDITNNVISAGGVYKREILFDSPNGYFAAGEITLLKSMLDYDDIEIIAGISSDADRGRTCTRINAQYFYDNFKYSTAHSAPHFGISFWYNMNVDITLGIDNTPNKLNFYGMSGDAYTSIYQINGIKY